MKSTSERWAISTASEGGRTTSDTWRLQQNTKCFSLIDNTTGTLTGEADFVSFDSDGFTWNYTTTGTNITNSVFIYIAIKGGLWDVGDHSIPATNSTVTTNTNATGNLKGVMLFNIQSNTGQLGIVGSHNTLSIGGTDGTRQSVINYCDNDAENNMVCTRIQSTSQCTRMMFANATAASSTTTSTGALSSFGATNFAIAYTNSDTNARLGNYFAVTQAPTPVTKTNTFKFNIIAEIIKTNTFKFNILSETTKSLTAKFNILSAITPKSLTAKFNIIAETVKTNTFKFNILSEVTKTLTALFNIQVEASSVEKTLTSKFSILSEITKTNTFLFNILTEVTKSLTGKFNIIAETVKSLTGKFNIIAEVIKTNTLLFNIVQEVVPKSLTAKFNILQEALKSLTSIFSIQAEVVKTNTFKFNIIAETVKTNTFKFNILNEVTPKSLTSKFNILQEAIKSITSLYNILSETTKSLTGKFNIIAETTKTNTFKFNIIQELTKTNTFKFNIIAEAVKSITSLFNISAPLQPVFKTLTSLFDIETTVVFPTLTSHESYTRELRARITFQSRDGLTTYYTYDSFNYLDRPFNIIAASVRLANGEVPTFQITIEDHLKQVIRTQIGNGIRVVIELAKHDTSYYQKVVTGLVRRCRRIRDKTNTFLYQIQGYGLQIVMNERITNFKRAAKRVDIDSSIPLSTDEKMLAYNLVNDLLTATDAVPLKNPTIQNTVGFTLDGISPQVMDFISQISPGLTDATSVVNAIAEITGTIWGVDGNGDFYFRYPTQLHSGILLKGIVEDEDSAESTGYYTGPLEFEDTIELSEGFANRLYVLNAKDTKSTASSSKGSGKTVLASRGIAVQWTATESNVIGAAFILSKIGEPTNTDNSVYGYLRSDKNGYPTGGTLATFKIPFDQIETSQSTLFINDIKTAEGVIVPGQKYWWYLYTAIVDASNNIRWHHDNDSTTSNRFSAVLPFTDTDPTKPGTQLNWVRSIFGPVYAFSTFSSVRHILTQSDKESIDRYGLVEAIVDIPAFDDDLTYQKALYKIIQYSALLKRIYTLNRVTIPYTKLYRPGELVSIIDNLSDLTYQKNIMAEISEVTYDFDAMSNGLGIKYVDLSCMAFIDEGAEEILDNIPC